MSEKMSEKINKPKNPKSEITITSIPDLELTPPSYMFNPAIIISFIVNGVSRDFPILVSGDAESICRVSHPDSPYFIEKLQDQVQNYLQELNTANVVSLLESHFSTFTKEPNSYHYHQNIESYLEITKAFFNVLFEKKDIVIGVKELNSIIEIFFKKLSYVFSVFTNGKNGESGSLTKRIIKFLIENSTIQTNDESVDDLESFVSNLEIFSSKYMYTDPQVIQNFYEQFRPIIIKKMPENLLYEKIRDKIVAIKKGDKLNNEIVKELQFYFADLQVHPFGRKTLELLLEEIETRDITDFKKILPLFSPLTKKEIIELIKSHPNFKENLEEK